MSMSFFLSAHTSFSVIKSRANKTKHESCHYIVSFFSSEIQCRIIVSSGLVTHDIYMIQYVVNWIQ